MAIIQQRRATEQEAQAFVVNRERWRAAARDSELKGMALFQSEREFLRSSQAMQCYYHAALNCIMWQPTQRQLFESWCDENKIERGLRDTMFIGWQGAWTFNVPPFDDALKAEIKIALEARRRKPQETRDRERREYFNQYLPEGMKA